MRISIVLALTAICQTLPAQTILKTATHNGHTYHMLSESSWASASKVASSLGGFLATVDDAAEDAFLLATFGKLATTTAPSWGIVSLWIGFNDVAQEGKWVWSSKSTASYRNWRRGEPAGTWPDEDFAGIYVSGFNSSWSPGQWHDIVIGKRFKNVSYGIVETVPLATDTATVSLSARGVQNFAITTGPQHANKLFLLLGTLSGTTPGINLGNNVTLPLNADAYLLNITLAFPNSPLLMNSLGKLDASGRATAVWTAIPLIPTALIGKTFHHAYVVIGNSPFDLASNAVPLKLLK